MRTVVIGIAGLSLDIGRSRRRWERWRPTVSVFQHDDLLVDRMELLCSEQHEWDVLIGDIARVAPETTVACHPLDFDDPWDFEEVYDRLLQWAKAYPFDPDNEEYLVHITTGTHVAQICFFLLVESRHVPGKLLQTGPPNRRSEQPDHPTYRLIDLNRSRYERLLARHIEDTEAATAFLKQGIATKSAAFNTLMERIERVAVASDAPILLGGPTGVGKTQLARRIFELRHSRHLVGPAFVEVNCATLRGDGAMSTLFGHKKGAFTGALSHRDGLLKAADGGTLFLDEIGELGLDEQAMLLRAIEDKQFTPMGADREATSSFMLIAGTNRDLRIDAAKGTFRADLLARINLWSFDLPSLRERIDDLDANVDYELERYAKNSGNRVRFQREARERYLRFALAPDALWLGNFRDLNASITRLCTLADAGSIKTPDVDVEVERLRADWRPAGDAPSTNTARLSDFLSEEQIAALDLFDKLQLEVILPVCQRARTMSDAGRTLFAVSREQKASKNDADRLRKYLLRFGLSWQDVRGG